MPNMDHVVFETTLADPKQPKATPPNKLAGDIGWDTLASVKNTTPMKVMKR